MWSRLITSWSMLTLTPFPALGLVSSHPNRKPLAEGAETVLSLPCVPFAVDAHKISIPRPVHMQSQSQSPAASNIAGINCPCANTGVRLVECRADHEKKGASSPQVTPALTAWLLCWVLDIVKREGYSPWRLLFNSGFLERRDCVLGRWKTFMLTKMVASHGPSNSRALSVPLFPRVGWWGRRWGCNLTSRWALEDRKKVETLLKSPFVGD
ncbi:hypothetical protein V8F33_004600 [Rhypophila sp. PSN 637]